MTTDLVTRLREGNSNLYDAAADEITRLRQENERLQQQVAWLLEQIRNMRNDHP